MKRFKLFATMTCLVILSCLFITGCGEKYEAKKEDYVGDWTASSWDMGEDPIKDDFYFTLKDDMTGTLKLANTTQDIKWSFTAGPEDDNMVDAIVTITLSEPFEMSDIAFTPSTITLKYNNTNDKFTASSNWTQANFFMGQDTDLQLNGEIVRK